MLLALDEPGDNRLKTGAFGFQVRPPLQSGEEVLGLDVSQPDGNTLGLAGETRMPEWSRHATEPHQARAPRWTSDAVLNAHGGCGLVRLRGRQTLCINYHGMKKPLHLQLGHGPVWRPAAAVTLGPSSRAEEKAIAPGPLSKTGARASLPHRTFALSAPEPHVTFSKPGQIHS